jgi:DsbE subfamily thiol:disulfide oxidoreductase
VLVVNFWASWCGPCREEQPILNTLAARYRQQGVKFIGINIRDNRGGAASFIKEHGVEYPSLFDPAARTAVDLQPVGIPDTIVFDRNGLIVYRTAGKVLQSKLLMQQLDVALLETVKTQAPITSR